MNPITGNKVALNKLILEGFGPYREKTEFIFSQGISCYVAGNETGKTTMVAGLIATFFGLTHRQRTVSSFTLERFRNWDNPPECRAEVYFSAGGRDYLVTRDFDTHRVELWLMDGGAVKKKLITEGIHNPEARKTLQAYEDKLLELLGMNSQELFRDTFCVEQPLPEPENISAELQGLLSGGKGTSFHSALHNLTEDLKSLTKYVGPKDRGISTRNLSKDGYLEQLENRILDMEKQIGEGRQKADALVDTQEQLLRIEEELSQKRLELANKEKIRQAWSDWQVLAGSYRSAARDRDKLRQAEQQALEVHNQIKQIELELDRDYPEFSDAPLETGDYLVELVNREKQLRKTDETIKSLEQALQSDTDKLRELVEQHEGYHTRELLGKDPVDKLKYIKRSAENCLREWRRFQQAMAEKIKIEKELKTRFSPFENATEDELQMAGDYRRQHTHLQREAEKAKQEYTAVEKKINGCRAARLETEARYADLQNLPEDAAAVIEEKLAALKRKRELEGAALKQPGKAASPFLPKIAGALIFAAMAGVFTGAGNIPVLVAVLVIAALAGFLTAGFLYNLAAGSGKSNSMEQQNLVENISRYDSKLASYASCDEAELGRLSQRLQHYAEEQQRLEALAREVSGEEIEKLRLKVEKTGAELNSYEKKILPFTAVYDDVPTALGEWKHLLEKRENLEKQLSSLAEEKFGCSYEKAASADPLAEGTAESWKETAGFLKVAAGNGAVQSAVTLVEHLDSFPESWWLEQEGKAVKLTGVKKDMETLKNKISALENRLEEEKNSSQKLREERDKLQGLIPGILEWNNNDAAAALDRWKRMRHRSRDKNAAAIQLKTILENNNTDEIAGLQSRAMEAQDNVTVTMHRWQEHIARNPGLPEAGQSDDLEQVSSYLVRLNTGIDQVNEEKTALEDTRNDLFRLQASLEGESPLNIAAAELELQELKQEKERMEITADALTMAYKELSEAINEYRHTYKERLEKQASTYCQKISHRPGRNIRLDDGFNISILEDGRHCTVEQMSKGARDQLYLSLRFGLADLLADEIKLPMIFDDPFTGTDARRLENIRKILHRQKAERQFIILAHAGTMSNWGNPVEINS